MKPATKPPRTAEQKAQEEAIRRRHATAPIQAPPVTAINQESFAALLGLIASLKRTRESQGLTVVDLASRMGIDVDVLAGLETGNMLNPSLAILLRWAEALGHQLVFDLRAA